MKFTREEKEKMLNYVASNLAEDCDLPMDESKIYVKNSTLVDKFNSSPDFIAHCSIGQLVDMVKKEKHLGKKNKQLLCV
ncbi:UNVERIFIED_CONTAM: hypothetical protein Cloal_0696 [Acetivibrio alkalicellulosi]